MRSARIVVGRFTRLFPILGFTFILEQSNASSMERSVELFLNHHYH